MTWVGLRLSLPLAAGLALTAQTGGAAPVVHAEGASEPSVAAPAVSPTTGTEKADALPGLTPASPVWSAPSAGPQGAPGAATAALLDELRQRAGIPPPGKGVAAPSAPTASQQGAPTGKPAQPADPALDLDPELKLALKEARDQVKESLAGQAVQESLRAASAPLSEHGATGGADAEADAASELAARRAALAAAGAVVDSAPQPSHTSGFGEFVTELMVTLRELLLNPATWLVLSLVVMVKLTLAVVAVRGQRSSRRRQRPSHPSHRQGAAPTTTRAAGLDLPPTSSSGSEEGSRRSSRHGQRQRRQQR